MNSDPLNTPEQKKHTNHQQGTRNMPDETDAALEKALDQNLANDVGAAPPPQPAAAALATPFPRRPISLRTAANGEQSLAAQYERIEEIQQQLKEKLRREKITLAHNYDRRKSEIRADFERQMNEAITKLERQMDLELRRAADEFGQKAREYEMLQTKYGL